MKNPEEFIKSIEYFQHMDDTEIQRIAAACRPESYDAGCVVIAENELKEKFYIIVEGAVQIFKNYGGQEESQLGILSKGQMFGELSLIDDLPRSATVLTSEPSEFLAIERHDFENLLSENSSLAFAIMRWIAAVIRRFNRNFVETIQLRNLELERANELLEREISVRKEKERQLNIYQSQLEEKVSARTKELRESNEKLKREVEFRRKTEAEKEKALFKLEHTVTKVKTLSGLFPLCIKCRKIRDDAGYWQQLEQYIQQHSEAEFRESLCDECAQKYFPKFYR